MKANKRPSRRRLKKWERRAQYIVRRAFDRGPDWFFRQTDLISRQHRLATRHGQPLLRALLVPAYKPSYDDIVRCLMTLFGRARPR